MSTLKGIAAAFSEIGKTTKSVEAAKGIEKTAVTLVKKTAAYATVPLGLGLGIGGGTYIAAQGISSSVNTLVAPSTTTNKTANTTSAQIASTAQADAKLIKLALAGILIYIIFLKK